MCMYIYIQIYIYYIHINLSTQMGIWEDEHGVVEDVGM